MNELQRRILSQGVLNSRPTQQDRRREARMRIARPVYLRQVDPNDVPFEEVRTMSDCSRIGFYFITARRESYHVGMQLYTIPALGCFNFEYLSEVLRIEPLRYGECGIAVKLVRTGNPVLFTSTVVPPGIQGPRHGQRQYRFRQF